MYEYGQKNFHAEDFDTIVTYLRLGKSQFKTSSEKEGIHITMRTRLALLFAFVLLVGLCNEIGAEDSNWTKLDAGLFVADFLSPQKSEVGHSTITIIKVNPKLFSFKLLCASEYNHSNMTSKEWCQRYNLIATINAGMFKTDYSTNVGYMKNFTHINNSTVNSKFLSVSSFNPINRSEPPFKIFDIDEENIKEIIGSYETVIQNLRLIKNPGENRWSKQNRRWSEAALGQDQEGNILFIFSRSPFSMHNFNNILLPLPINIVCAQHLEGGPPASLYLSHKGIEISKVGSYETRFNENDNNTSAWEVPNVIGFFKRKNRQ